MPSVTQDELAPQLSKAKTSEEACYNALKFYSSLQAEDGHWAGDYGGPLFLMPGECMRCNNDPYLVRLHKLVHLLYALCTMGGTRRPSVLRS